MSEKTKPKAKRKPARKLNIKRPVIFFDLETTGVSVANDRIVEIGLVKLFPGGKKEVKTRVLNPTIEIPKEASDVHGITNIDVQDMDTFSEIAKSMNEYFKGCDLCGYNSNRFDIPLLVEEFLRCGISFPAKDVKFIDVFKIFTINEQRTLEAAFKFYCKKALKNAHSAQADIDATVDILEAQIKKYKKLPLDVAGLDEFCREGKEVVDYAGCITKDDNGEFIYNFGKHKGKRILDEIGYAEWMLKNDFTRHTKKKLKEIIY